jgi:small GTP-binding protein
MCASEQVLKIVLLGDPTIGKSRLLLRYTEDTFDDHFHWPIGVSFVRKHIEIESFRVQLQIWDIPASEAFRTIVQFYYPRTHGILVVFDISQRWSFDDTKKWIDSVRVQQ